MIAATITNGGQRHATPRAASVSQLNVDMNFSFFDVPDPHIAGVLFSGDLPERDAGSNFALNAPDHGLGILSRTSVFFRHIIKVIGVRTKKQMVRVNASSIVAGVTDKFVFWCWAGMEFIRKPVSRLNGSLAVNGDSELPVAMTANAFSPEPAVAGLVNVVKKSVLYRTIEDVLLERELFAAIAAIFNKFSLGHSLSVPVLLNGSKA